MNNLIKKGLESCSLFSDLKPNQLRRLERNSRLLHYQARDLVFSQSQPASGLYLVTEGKVALLLRLTNGKKRMLNIVGPGGVLGKESLFSAKEYSVSARSLEETAVLYIEKGEINWLLRGDSQLYARLVEELSGEIRTLQCKLAEASYIGAKQRLARVLLTIAKRHGDQGVELRRSELASLVGVSSKTAIRKLSSLEERGAVQVNGGKIKILDEDYLKNLVDPYLVEEIGANLEGLVR